MFLEVLRTPLSVFPDSICDQIKYRFSVFFTDSIKNLLGGCYKTISVAYEAVCFVYTQLIFTYSKSTIETLEKSVTYVQT